MDPNAANAAGSVILAGDQQIVLSAEDAANLLAQAGIQIGDNEQVVIGQAGATPGAAGIGIRQEGVQDGQQVIDAALTAAQQATDQVR